MKLKLTSICGAILAAYILAAPYLHAPSIQAQDETPTPASATITGEGLNGDIDKKRRAPTVTIGVNHSAGNVQILVDAYIADPTYKEFPIQFDFYVNRKFFTSQIRSKELPGPIGIDVASSLVPLPFNYTVIATTLHTNRQFKTMVNGAVFSSNLNTTFDCTLTTGVNSNDSTEYIVNNTELSQTANNTITINFESDSTPDGHSAKAAFTVTINGTNAAGTLTLEEDESEAKTIALTGSVEKEGEAISSLTLNSSDSDVSLSCS